MSRRRQPGRNEAMSYPSLGRSRSPWASRAEASTAKLSDEPIRHYAGEEGCAQAKEWPPGCVAERSKVTCWKCLLFMESDPGSTTSK